MVFLDDNNDLLVIIHPKKLYKFDFLKGKWTFIKDYYYNFDKIYQYNGYCFMFNK